MYWLFIPFVGAATNLTVLSFSPVSYGILVFVAMLIFLNVITFTVQFIYLDFRRFKDMRGHVSIAPYVIGVFNISFRDDYIQNYELNFE